MLPWPLPALMAWLLAWFAYKFLLSLNAPLWGAFILACALGGLWARAVHTTWRRTFVFCGFPLSWLLLGVVSAQGPIVALWWLVPVVLLCSLYPLNAWSDAPLFPTPSEALKGLSSVATLPSHSLIVDAGCGLGAGLRALAGEYPQARLIGWEWSRPLAWLCRWRCAGAEVSRADIWAQDWSGFQMVYLFQRPESMPRAGAKASAELAAGAYLVSLEFEWLGARPLAKIESVSGKPVWIYQAPFEAVVRPIN
jgi:hypothetical protein